VPPLPSAPRGAMGEGRERATASLLHLLCLVECCAYASPTICADRPFRLLAPRPLRVLRTHDSRALPSVLPSCERKLAVAPSCVPQVRHPRPIRATSPIGPPGGDGRGQGEGFCIASPPTLPRRVLRSNISNDLCRSAFLSSRTAAASCPAYARLARLAFCSSELRAQARSRSLPRASIPPSATDPATSPIGPPGGDGRGQGEGYCIASLPTLPRRVLRSNISNDLCRSAFLSSRTAAALASCVRATHAPCLLFFRAASASSQSLPPTSLNSAIRDRSGHLSQAPRLGEGGVRAPWPLSPLSLCLNALASRLVNPERVRAITVHNETRPRESVYFLSFSSPPPRAARLHRVSSSLAQHA